MQKSRQWHAVDINHLFRRTNAKSYDRCYIPAPSAFFNKQMVCCHHSYITICMYVCMCMSVCVYVYVYNRILLLKLYEFNFLIVFDCSINQFLHYIHCLNVKIVCKKSMSFYWIFSTNFVINKNWRQTKD